MCPPKWKQHDFDEGNQRRHCTLKRFRRQHKQQARLQIHWLSLPAFPSAEVYNKGNACKHVRICSWRRGKKGDLSLDLCYFSRMLPVWTKQYENMANRWGKEHKFSWWLHPGQASSHVPWDENIFLKTGPFFNVMLQCVVNFYTSRAHLVHFYYFSAALHSPKLLSLPLANILQGSSKHSTCEWGS